MSKKIYIKTFGCQMNEYDSARLVEMLQERLEMECVESPEKADLILLNTCSVREKAQEKVFSDLGRWKLIKAEKPELVIGVGGCVAAQEKENVIKRAPCVDFVFGPTSLHKVPEMYAQILAKRQKLVETSCLALEKFSNLPEHRAEGVSAFVTIMEGCNKYCSYCIVPFTRGKEISRYFAEVSNEVKMLLQQGVKEIYFLGQNVNDYQGEKPDGNIASLAELIEEVAEFPELKRIRFTTSYPTSFSEELVNVFAQEPKLVNHLHLPVQSGSNRILKAMRRRYTTEEYQEKIAALRTVRPDISISSDFIVGFPGETEADFQQTLDFVEKINFDSSFSFIYSPRPGTLAAKLPDLIPLAEKKRRLQALQKQLNLQAGCYSNRMLGTTQEVLVVGPAKKDQTELSGRTENNRIVNFVGNKELIGMLVNVKITEVLTNSLRGILCL